MKLEFELELSDVEVEGVLPKGFSEGKSADEFMAMLPQLDEEFKTRVSTAKAEGKVLRYVGKICEGKCKVSIVAVDHNNPLYKVKDGEKCFGILYSLLPTIPLLLRVMAQVNAVLRQVSCRYFKNITTLIRIPNVKNLRPASSANISVGFDTLGAAISPIDGSLLGDVVQIESISSGLS